MTELLETKIGREVSCLFVDDGKMQGIRGILNAVDDQYVTINGDRISYINDNFAIYAIYEGQSKVLYLNQIALEMSNMHVPSYSTPDGANQEPTDQTIEDNNAIAPEEPSIPSPEEFNDMFEALKEKIGTKVSLDYMFKGNKSNITGVLQNAVAYDFVTVDYQMVPFIGPYDGIFSITTLDGITLFSNEMAKEYKGCRPEKLQEMFAAQEKYLGRSVAHEEYLHKNL